MQRIRVANKTAHSIKSGMQPFVAPRLDYLEEGF